MSYIYKVDYFNHVLFKESEHIQKQIPIEELIKLLQDPFINVISAIKVQESEG